MIGDGRVIAIGAGEPPRDVIERAAGLRRKRARREGVAVIGAAHEIDEAILVAANDAKLGGVVAVGASFDLENKRGVVRLADKLGLFIAATEVAEGGGRR